MSLTSVSYTHLDVYKRQEQTRAAMIYNLGRGGEVAGSYLLDRVLEKQSVREQEERHDR